jgi:hypothetical protein
MLPAELLARKLLATQVAPQQALGIGCVGTQCRHEGSLVG